MKTIFDTHAHYTSARFDDHRDTLLQSLPAGRVSGVMECAVDYADSLRTIALCEQYSFIYGALGIHPESLIEDDTSTTQVYGGDWRAELADIAPLLKHPRVRAVGEIGLDYHWPIPKPAQTELFCAQLELAKNAGLPVLVHDREAHGDMYDILRQVKPRGILHCYSGSPDDAAWITAQGMYLGVGGTVTFKNARHIVDTVRAVPLQSLVLETDCPYMAPEPFRGKENNSKLILYVAQRVAEIKDITVSEVLRVTRQNACRLFEVDDAN